MPRRAQTSTPPKPASDILANATNSAIRPGGVDVADSGISGAGTATGGESGGHGRDLERRLRKANRYSSYSTPKGCSRPKRPPRALFFSTFAPYIGGCRLAGYGNKVPPQ